MAGKVSRLALVNSDFEVSVPGKAAIKLCYSFLFITFRVRPRSLQNTMHFRCSSQFPIRTCW